MFITKDLSQQSFQQLLTNRVELINNMKKIAMIHGIDVGSGKWLYKYENTKLHQQHVSRGFPSNYPERQVRLLEVLDIYIECKKYNHPITETPEQQMLFTEFRALDKKLSSPA